MGGGRGRKKRNLPTIDAAAADHLVLEEEGEREGGIREKKKRGEKLYITHTFFFLFVFGCCCCCCWGLCPALLRFHGAPHSNSIGDTSNLHACH